MIRKKTTAVAIRDTHSKEDDPAKPVNISVDGNVCLTNHSTKQFPTTGPRTAAAVWGSQSVSAAYRFNSEKIRLSARTHLYAASIFSRYLAGPVNPVSFECNSIPGMNLIYQRFKRVDFTDL